MNQLGDLILYARRARWFWAALTAVGVASCGAPEDLTDDDMAADGALSMRGVTFQTVLGGQFVGAANNGGGAVNAVAIVARTWETFTLTDRNGGSLVSGDSVFIQAGSGQYFQALNGGGSTLNAGSSAKQSWETFKVVSQSGSGAINNGDIIGLESVNGNWVSAANGGGGPVSVDGGALGSRQQLRIKGLPGGGSGGGSGTDGGGSGGASGTGRPAIDFSIWSLQLPIGSGTSPVTISPSRLRAGYSDPYFSVASDGGQIYMSPATGITTPGSKHCRTEMREMTAGGSPAAWPSTGTNTMTVSGRVLQVGGGSRGTVTLGQVFIGTDSIPLAELQYGTSLGGFKLFYEEAKGVGTTFNLGTKVALGERYTFQLALNAGVLNVSINGNPVFSKTPSPATVAKRFYFKAGNYDQNTTAGPISTTPFSTVEVYSVEVVHR